MRLYRVKWDWELNEAPWPYKDCVFTDPNTAKERICQGIINSEGKYCTILDCMYFHNMWFDEWYHSDDDISYEEWVKDLVEKRMQFVEIDIL